MDSETAANQEHRLIVAGFGGQGSLTAGKLLCMAAMAEGRQVTYLPSYGAEVRGGTANCQVVISPEPVYSPLVDEADSLIILNQLSFDRFTPKLKPAGLMVVNSSVVDLTEGSRQRDGMTLAVPATELAAEMGNVLVANMIMVGAFVGSAPIVPHKSCVAALKELLGRRKAHLFELNVQALQKGAELAG